MNVAVSVVMAVHNGSPYVAQALESILTQNGVEFEFIVLDDASTDSTPDILRHYAAQDPRLILLHQPQQQGLTRSLNAAIAHAKGPYIARQDADDISLAGRLQQQAAYLDAHPKVVLVGGAVRLIDATGQPIGQQQRAAPPAVVAFGLHFFNYIGGHSGVMFRREAFQQVGGYDPYFRFSQDYDLWARMLSVGELAVLPSCWLALRQHNTNLSLTHHSDQERLSLEISQRLQASLRTESTAPPPPQVEALRYFWLDIFHEMGLGAGETRSSWVHHHLTELYAAFRTRYQPTSADQRAIRGAIAGHFMRWARSVSLRARPRDKLRLWQYAIRWGAWAWIGV